MSTLCCQETELKIRPNKTVSYGMTDSLGQAHHFLRTRADVDNEDVNCFRLRWLFPFRGKNNIYE